jgi:hypothetical protein
MSNCVTCGQPLPKPLTFAALSSQDWFRFVTNDEMGSRLRKGPFQKIGENGAYMDAAGSYWAIKGKMRSVLVLKAEAP